MQPTQPPLHTLGLPLPAPRAPQVSQLWKEVVTRVAADYPDVELSHMYIGEGALRSPPTPPAHSSPHTHAPHPFTLPTTPLTHPHPHTPPPPPRTPGVHAVRTAGAAVDLVPMLLGPQRTLNRSLMRPAPLPPFARLRPAQTMRRCS